MITSAGAVELTPALTDDDRRDFELHMRGVFGPSLSVQVKTALKLRPQGRKTNRLKIYIHVKRDHLRTDPLLWYFFAHFDLATMRFTDPVFLVPSYEVHRHAAPRLAGKTWRFMFEASVEEESHDHWRPYRFPRHDLGARLLRAMTAARAAVGALPRVASL